MQNKFEFTKKAYKQLLKLPKDIQIRIQSKLISLKNIDDLSPYFVRIHNIKNVPYRLRIGNYRLFPLLINTTKNKRYFIITKVAHRKEIYFS